MESNDEASDSEYVIHPKKDTDNTSMWPYFLISRDRDKQTAKCKLCKKIIRIKGGSTKGLHVHYTSQHHTRTSASTSKSTDVTVCSSDSNFSPPFKKQKQTINDYFVSFHENTLDAVIARMTSLDGLPFRVFVSSHDLRVALEARGFSNIPNSVTTICNRVLAYQEKIVSHYIQEISSLKKNNNCFSLTLDEWTSTANKRYINVNLHGMALMGVSSSEKVWNLGLIRIQGSLPAEDCVILLTERLQKFNISLDDDIICVTTDGASVMKKFGYLIKPNHQLCFAHAIHLAVSDVLYKNINVVDNTATEDNDIGISDSDDEEGGFDLEREDPVQQLEIGDRYDLTENYNIHSLIEKVRKVVRMFRRSPVKNNTLQKYIVSKHGKELNLILDCKTRWNSLLTMIERFALLKDCVQKTLIDLEYRESLTENEFTFLGNIVKCLQPIKLGVEAICRRDANLSTADATFKFLFAELNKIGIDLSRNLLFAIKKRVAERRNIMSDVFAYLQNPAIFTSAFGGKEEVFEHFDSNAIAEFIKNCTESVIGGGGVLDDDDDEEESIPLAEVLRKTKSSGETALKEVLQKAIEAASKPQKPQKGSLAIIKKEMALYENGGLRGLFLQKCYERLITISPTSVEAERAFSAAGALLTKIRSRLKDASIDALVFLRGYFNNIRNMKVK